MPADGMCTLSDFRKETKTEAAALQLDSFSHQQEAEEISLHPLFSLNDRLLLF